MKKTLITVGIGLAMALTPVIASAHSLTGSQIGAVIGLLRSFGVEEYALSQIQAILAPQAPIGSATVSVAQNTAIAAPVAVSGLPAVYKLVYEYGMPDVYLWTDIPVDSSSLNVSQDGNPVTTVFSLSFSKDVKDCIVIWSPDGSSSKKCGGTVQRFVSLKSLAPGEYTLFTGNTSLGIFTVPGK